MNSSGKAIRQVGVAGAGTMGSAIAQYFAMKGLDVVLMDVSQAGVERGIQGIRASLDEAVARKVINEAEHGQILGRIRPATDVGAIAPCDLVVEAVFEDFQVKSRLFADLEKVVGSDCILATNTSSFAVSDLAKSVNRPERFAGVHYFYHAAKNKLVEIIPGAKTSPEVTDRLVSFYEYIGKIAVTTRDVPGFCVNRFFVPWLNEAARLFDEGYGSPAFIDTLACQAFRVGMGPFALMNATGVPIALHAANNLAAAFGPFYAPAAGLAAQVEAGKPWDLTVAGKGADNEAVVRTRLLGATLGVAAQMVSEEVTDVTSTDLAARIGLRWSVGPFELIERLGGATVTGMVREVFGKWDMPLPQVLTGESAGKLTVHDVRYYRLGRAGVIEFNRPDAMNALSEKVMQQLEAAFTAAEADPGTERIVFAGRGKAFVAGADIKFFLKNMAKGDTERIYRFTEAGQKLLSRIESSAKPTMAYLDGLTLGGGLELALACQHRIATERLVAAFPETGIGIYPGLGGTQRAPRLIGKGIAKFLIATGQMINAAKAMEYGLVDAVIPRLESLADLASMPLPRNPVRGRGAPVPEAGFAAFRGDPGVPGVQEDLFKTFAKPIGFKAPLALKKAMELIDAGSDVSLKEGLALELRDLHWIFGTADAKIGLESLTKREKPKFIGA